MSTTEVKQLEFRERLAALSDVDLARRVYLCGLVSRIDNELLALSTLFGAPDEPLKLAQPPDTKLTTLQHLMQVELKRRCSATKAINGAAAQQKRPIGEQHDHANGTH
jgi:hypothetical protein